MNEEKQIRQLFREIEQSHKRNSFWIAAAAVSVAFFLCWLIGLFS